jgi:hypothetical protein
MKSMSDSQTYTVVAAPKFAGMIAYDCAECDHTELKRPVFLSSGSGVSAYGSGCAAVLVYGRKDAKTVRLLNAEFELAQHKAIVAEEMASERREAYAIANASLIAGIDGCPYLCRARTTWKGRGLGFLAWVEMVAKTGELGF